MPHYLYNTESLIFLVRTEKKVDITKESQSSSLSTLIAVNGFGGMIFGYNTGAIALALNPIKRDFPMTDMIAGVLSASILMGALIGSATAGTLCDRLGRKKSLLVMSIFATVGPLLTLASPLLPVLCVARAIVGYGKAITLHKKCVLTMLSGVGLASVCCPLYVSEMASNKTRGRLGTLFQITLTFGIFLSYIVSYCILLDPSFVGSWGWDWRTMFGVGTFIGLANLIVSVFYVTESPLWLAMHAKKGQNVEMGATKANKDESESKEENEGWAGLVARKNAKQVLLGSVLAVSLQLTGTNAIFYYAPVILNSAGFDIASILTLVIGGWNFVASLFPLILIDRAGRRPLMIAGLAMMTGALIIVAAAFYATEPLITGIIALIGIIIFIFGFETGPGANFWVLVSEIFPNSIRESAPSFINMQQWVFNIALTLAFPSMVSGIGASSAFWIFAGICVACTIFIAISLRESKGAALGGTTTVDKKGKNSEELA